ncbi:MAG TPA: GntR family transcriptional regulator [Gemmatimonadaceae bacterium]|nr:GntR family transcriptional regulator [Gemmatimonadaceae bacterium]
MKERISRDSPVPLYHQIAEALRNAIAVGELRAGEKLPPVRDAAAQWGVNLHTVRRAYDELAREGLLRVSAGRGTEVAAAAGSAAPVRDLTAFLASLGRTAQRQFGLSQLQLAQLLLKRAAAGAPPAAYFIECSREQAEQHCDELMTAWRVHATPLVLGEVRNLPAGILIGTYFHYNDIRRRWPDRLDEVRFVAISPDAALSSLIPAHRRKTGRTRLLVCELDQAKAMNIAADLQALFPDRDYLIQPKMLESATRLPHVKAGDVLLVAPRVWGGMTDAQRARVVPIRYRVRSHELEALGTSFGWERAATERIA